MYQPVPQFLTREDCNAQLCQVFISACVVAMDVSVDQKSNGLIRDLLDCRHNLVCQRSELAIHHEHAVRARQNAYRASLPVQDIEIRREFHGFNLDLAEIGGLAEGVTNQAQRRQHGK
jgi:hypothetical protein